jgi:hypothetical protein
VDKLCGKTARVKNGLDIQRFFYNRGFVDKELIISTSPNPSSSEEGNGAIIIILNHNSPPPSLISREGD